MFIAIFHLSGLKQLTFERFNFILITLEHYLEYIYHDLPTISKLIKYFSCLESITWDNIVSKYSQNIKVADLG